MPAQQRPVSSACCHHPRVEGGRGKTGGRGRGRAQPRRSRLEYKPALWALGWSLSFQGLAPGRTEGRQCEAVPCPPLHVLGWNATSLSSGAELSTQGAGETRREQEAAWPLAAQAGLGVPPCSLLYVP